MAHERWLDRDCPPGEAEIAAALGDAAAPWDELRGYLATAYAVEPETVFGGRNYGWCLRYRKGGRPLCTLYPEQGAFTVLVVLGKQEIERVQGLEGSLSAGAWAQFTGANQYHDGRWLWCRVPEDVSVADICGLLAAKRRPIAGSR